MKFRVSEISRQFKFSLSFFADKIKQRIGMFINKFLKILPLPLMHYKSRQEILFICWDAHDLRNSFWRFRLQVQLQQWWLIADYDL